MNRSKGRSRVKALEKLTAILHVNDGNVIRVNANGKCGSKTASPIRQTRRRGGGKIPGSARVGGEDKELVIRTIGPVGIAPISHDRPAVAINAQVPIRAGKGGPMLDGTGVLTTAITKAAVG